VVSCAGSHEAVQPTPSGFETADAGAVHGERHAHEVEPSLAFGYGRVCTVTAQGRLWCAGDNNFGQLGDGTTINRPEPRFVEGLHRWTRPPRTSPRGTSREGSTTAPRARGATRSSARALEAGARGPPWRGREAFAGQKPRQLLSDQLFRGVGLHRRASLHGPRSWCGPAGGRRRTSGAQPLSAEARPCLRNTRR
jgi:hypothetical protein